MEPILSVFQKHFQGDKRNMEGVIWPDAIGSKWIGIIYPADYFVRYMFHLLFVHITLFVTYLSGTWDVKNSLEFLGCKKYGLNQALSWTSPFEVQLYFHVLMSLKYCIPKEGFVYPAAIVGELVLHPSFSVGYNDMQWMKTGSWTGMFKKCATSVRVSQ